MPAVNRVNLTYSGPVRRSSALLATVGLTLLASVMPGCYRPKIQDGSLRCGPGDLCPDGFVCNALGVCAQRGAPAADMAGSNGIWSGALGAKDLTGLTGVLECSTKSGDIVLNNGASFTPIVTAPMAGFMRVDQINGPAVSVWSFQTLFIPAGITVRPTSDSDALSVFATVGDLTVEGDIDWRGFGGFGGRSNEAGTAKSVPFVAGGQPGTSDGDGGGGGGGGGHATPGVMGAGSGGGVGGMAYGSPDLAPLYAGSGGGGGGGVGGRGGPGGGAFALISQAGITIAGQINVSGTDGFSGGTGTGGGGGGGGSGGGLILSGTHITLATNHELLARGGSGAAGSGTGSPGSPGSPGGAGANGRIWIGGDFTAGELKATPAPTFSPNRLLTFPSP